ncbi:MAG: translation initiation factor IF-3 [Firmicutes bacterium]|nr:translation initiation factor IF-3 [Bacillota bacterium]
MAIDKGTRVSDRGLRVNENIRAREVRVIDENGEQLGVMIPREALRIARERGLDLVEVAPNARPPVCRVMDYGKYMYEKSKKERESRKNQKTVKIKEVRISPKIDDHDFSVRVKNAVGFLQKGNKVKATVRFRGREIVHADIGKKLLEDLAEFVQDYAVVERDPKVEGRNMIMILAPKQSE